MSLTEFNQEEYDRNRYDEGKEAGIREGKEAGIMEGKAAGKLEGFIETAKKFLKMGLPLQQVAEGTGLSIEQLKQLAKA